MYISHLHKSKKITYTEKNRINKNKSNTSREKKNINLAHDVLVSGSE